MSESQGARSRARGKSFLSLITDVPHLISQLIRAEIELLKAELVSKLKAVGIGLGLFVISLSLVLLALLLLIFAGVFALSLVLPLWAATLIVAGVVILAAIVVAGIGAAVMSRSKSPLPNETVESIREDIRVVRGRK
ncbi:MAG: phage holin family protein [Pontimonas sp.]|nr:phage holin family protein [Pontimonas sp.]